MCPPRRASRRPGAETAAPQSSRCARSWPARSEARRRQLFSLAALLCLGVPLLARSAPDAFTLDEIAPGVFVHPGKALALDAPGHDDIANIGFVVGARCVAVIDTGGSVRIGRALQAALRGKT